MQEIEASCLFMNLAIVIKVPATTFSNFHDIFELRFFSLPIRIFFLSPQNKRAGSIGMAGSKLSAYFFVFSGLMLLIQTAVILAVYEDVVSTFIAALFSLIMFYGAKCAATGVKLPVYRYLGEYDIGGDHVVVSERTGQFTDSAPQCGCVIGILILVIAYLYADFLSYDLGDAEAIALVSPSLLAGIFGIFAGIIYLSQKTD
ncbi:MAG: hypothetical protein K9W43_01785 [Candidatus Thorarchaeota archaeon]|nr:hypothetical protein [Candidatus Thorarchaeota archaeon]